MQCVGKKSKPNTAPRPSDKDKLLQTARKSKFYIEEKRMTAGFSSETMQSRRQQSNIFIILKKKQQHVSTWNSILRKSIFLK